MKRIFAIVILSFLVEYSIAPTISQGQQMLISVTDENGDLIKGVPIYLDGYFQGLTDSNGQVNLQRVAQGGHVIEARFFELHRGYTLAYLEDTTTGRGVSFQSSSIAGGNTYTVVNVNSSGALNLSISMTEEAQADKIPWAGYWWSIKKGELARGYDRDGDGDLDPPSPMGKYDSYVVAKGDPNPGAEAWELQEHYDPNAASWWGHCHAWASAAVLEKEPRIPRTTQGINFEVGDQKGLVTECHDNSSLDFWGGTRYNGPSDNIDDIYPNAFAYALQHWIRDKKEPLVMDTYAGDQVWNFPFYKYSMTFVPSGGDRVDVTCTVWLVNDGVAPNHVTDVNDGESVFTKTYNFWIRIGADGRILGVSFDGFTLTGSGTHSGWLGSSVNNHPDFLWHSNRPMGGNPKLDYDTVLEITYPLKIKDIKFSRTYYQKDKLKIAVQVNRYDDSITSFYIGWSIRDPSGNLIDLPAKNCTISSDTAEYILSYDIPTSYETGMYDLMVKLWKSCTPTCTDEYDGVHILEAFRIESSEVNEAIKSGLAWLRTQQNVDGSWSFRGSPNVGITAMAALSFLNHGVSETDPDVQSAVNYILAHQTLIAPDQICFGSLCNYETSLAILALAATHNSDYEDEIEKARNYLVAIQNDEDTSYAPSSPFYGGWGYPWSNWADLSNTQWTLMALDAAGLSKTDETWGKAKLFVTRCQNLYSTNPDYAVNDNGSFSYQPPSINPPYPQEGYGSMTAAGTWSLLLCGVSPADQRVESALNWLKDNYSPIETQLNPGLGDDWLYYYLLSFSKALVMTGFHEDWENQASRDISEYIVSHQVGGHWLSAREGALFATVQAILALETRITPTDVERMSYITLILHSAADLHIYDPEGNHIGKVYGISPVMERDKDPEWWENSIPFAVFDPNEPQIIILPAPISGEYRIELVGRYGGQCDLSISASVGGRTVFEGDYSSAIKNGETVTYSVFVASLFGGLNLYVTPPTIEREPPKKLIPHETPSNYNQQIQALARWNIKRAEELLEEAEHLIDTLKEKGIPIPQHVVDLLVRGETCLEEARKWYSFGNYIAANYWALQAQEYLQEANDELNQL